MRRGELTSSTLNDLAGFSFGIGIRIKQFQIDSIQKVEYLQNIGDEALHDIIYNLHAQTYQKDEMLQRYGDNAEELYFL